MNLENASARDDDEMREFEAHSERHRHATTIGVLNATAEQVDERVSCKWARTYSTKRHKLAINIKASNGDLTSESALFAAKNERKI